LFQLLFFDNLSDYVLSLLRSLAHLINLKIKWFDIAYIENNTFVSAIACL